MNFVPTVELDLENIDETVKEPARSATPSVVRTTDGGRAFEVDDEVWARAEQMDYVGGYPIYARRTF